MSHTLTISEQGTVSFVYSDELRPVVAALGHVSIRRASNVEPDEKGEWVADLSPIGGPRLGPYVLRREALNEEVIWLENWFKRTGGCAS